MLIVATMVTHAAGPAGSRAGFHSLGTQSSGIGCCSKKSHII